MEESWDIGDGFQRWCRGISQIQYQIALIGPDVLAYVTGCHIKCIRLGTPSCEVIRMFYPDLEGIELLESKPTGGIFAIAERARNPRIAVYRFMNDQEFQLCELTDGAQNRYRAIRFCDEDLFLGLSGVPDLCIYIWNWTTREQILVVKCLDKGCESDILISPVNSDLFLEYSRNYLTFYELESLSQETTVVRSEVVFPKNEAILNQPDPRQGDPHAIDIISAIYDVNGQVWVLDQKNGIHKVPFEEKFFIKVGDIDLKGEPYGSTIECLVPYGPYFGAILSTGAILVNEGIGKVMIQDRFKFSSRIKKYIPNIYTRNSFYAITDIEKKVENVTAGKIQSPFKFLDLTLSEIQSVCFIESEAKYLAVVTEIGGVYILETATGNARGKWSLPVYVESIISHPLLPMVVVGTADGCLLFLDVRRLKEPKVIHRSFLCEDTEIDKLTFTCRGKYLIAGDSRRGLLFLTYGLPSMEFTYLDCSNLNGNFIRAINTPSNWKDKRLQVVLQQQDTDEVPFQINNYRLDHERLELVSSQLLHAAIKTLCFSSFSKLMFSYTCGIHSIGMSIFSEDIRDGPLKEPEIRFKSTTIESHINRIFIAGDRLFTLGEDGHVLQHKIPDDEESHLETDEEKDFIHTHFTTYDGIKDGFVSMNGRHLLTIGHDNTIVHIKLKDDSEKVDWEQIDFGEESDMVAITNAQMYYFKMIDIEKNTELNDDELDLYTQAFNDEEIFQKRRFESRVKFLKDEIEVINNEVAILMDENETYPPEEQLPIDAFELNEIQKKLNRQVMKEDKQIAEIVVKSFIEERYAWADKMKKLMWDDFEAKFSKLNGFNTKRELTNYPLKAYTDDELRDLKVAKIERWMGLKLRSLDSEFTKAVQDACDKVKYFRKRRRIRIPKVDLSKYPLKVRLEMRRMLMNMIHEEEDDDETNLKMIEEIFMNAGKMKMQKLDLEDELDDVVEYDDEGDDDDNDEALESVEEEDEEGEDENEEEEQEEEDEDEESVYKYESEEEDDEHDQLKESIVPIVFEIDKYDIDYDIETQNTINNATKKRNKKKIIVQKQSRRESEITTLEIDDSSDESDSDFEYIRKRDEDRAIDRENHRPFKDRQHDKYIKTVYSGGLTHTFFEPDRTLFEQLDLVSLREIRVQNKIIRSEIRNLKTFFNNSFEELKRFKDNEIKLMKMRNERIREIGDFLEIIIDIKDYEPWIYETPEKIFEIDDSEVPGEKYVPIEEDEEEEEEMEEEKALELQLSEVKEDEENSKNNEEEDEEVEEEMDGEGMYDEEYDGEGRWDEEEFDEEGSDVGSVATGEENAVDNTYHESDLEEEEGNNDEGKSDEEDGGESRDEEGESPKRRERPEEIFNVTIPMPDFMMNTDKWNWSIEEAEKADLYNKQLAELEAQKAKVKKEVIRELRTLWIANVDAKKEFDLRLQKLGQEKLDVDLAIKMEEVKLCRLIRQVMKRFDIDKEEHRLKSNLKRIQDLNKGIHTVAIELIRKVENASTQYKFWTEKGNMLERTFKANLGGEVGYFYDNLVKQYKKRPKVDWSLDNKKGDMMRLMIRILGNPGLDSVQYENMVWAKEVMEAIQNMDNPIQIPVGCPRPTWDRFCRVLHDTIICEYQAKLCINELQVLHKVLSIYKGREAEGQKAVAGILSDLSVQRDLKVAIVNNIEFQMVFRDGQIELESTIRRKDFYNALVLNKNLIQNMYAHLKKREMLKLKRLRQIRDQNRLMKQIEWKCEQVQLEEKHLREKLKDINKFTITKEVTDYLRITKNFKDEQERRLKDLRRLYNEGVIAQNGIMKHDKNIIREVRGKIGKLLKITGKKEEQIQAQNLYVSEARYLCNTSMFENKTKMQQDRANLIMHIGSYNRQIAKNSNEIHVLETELNRLYKKTFPIL